MRFLNKTSTTFLNGIDKLIKYTVEKILSLLSDVPNSRIYSPRNFRELGLVKANSEACMYNI